MILEERIYIPENLANLIDSYLKDVKANFNANVMARSNNAGDPNLWYKTWEKHQKSVDNFGFLRYNVRANICVNFERRNS